MAALPILLVFLPQMTYTMEQSALYRNPTGDLSLIDIRRYSFHYLWAGKITSSMVEDQLDCTFLCVAEPKCYSFNMAAYPDSKGLYLCELLTTDKYRETKTFNTNATFHHYSPWSPCESDPCKNGADCIPEYELNSYRCHCKLGYHGIHCEHRACKFDFEDGIDGWTRTGTAFNNQPTYGDNPTARNTQPAKQQGDWWIGGYEDRPSQAAPAGQTQGDNPQGTLTSPYFNITGKTISFLIGGGCDINTIRAELQMESQVIRRTTGKCSETMAPESWEVQEFVGKRARVQLVDHSSGGWGHINFDDLKGDIICEQN